jgi:hypothetical protein
MTLKLLALFVGVALLAGGCGERVVYVAPSAAPDVPSLTAQAAIGLVSSTCRNPGVAHLIRSGARAVYQGKGIWGVEYESAQWEVYEAGGVVAPIGDSPLHIACQREPSE